MRNPISTLSCSSLDALIYGKAPNPLSFANGMVIGGGTVYPEINFTLPSMVVEEATMPEVLRQYREMTTGVLKRAHELQAPGVVVEIELLPPMTITPKWGLAVTEVVLDVMGEYQAKGLKSLLRLTPNDTREHVRPPVMRSGALWEGMLETFDGAAKLGSHMLSVESTGGKEIHDSALVNGNLAQAVFGLGVMGCRDMEFLWSHIADIAKKHNAVAAGDSACGFANTAMVLADRGMISPLFAAVIRVASVSRALVAFECGAKGPSKDCAYEGPFMKAMAGVPISMEGKSSACAHLSPVGNIVAATADLWSNESVQNVKLLGEMAPTVSMEQLVYDCRLFNQATKEGPETARILQRLLVNSDSSLDPQAYVLRPDVVLKLSERMVAQTDPYLRTKVGAQAAIEVLREGLEKGDITATERQTRWLDIMQDQLDELPDDAQGAWETLKDDLDLDAFIPSEYGLD